VGITRAMERLHLSHAWARTLYGATQYNPPSRFLDEIPSHLMEEIESERRAERGRRSSSGDRWTGWNGGGSVDGWTRRSEARERQVDAALRPSGPTPSGADQLDLAVGDDVRHSTFGEGVILALEGRGEKAEARVHFAGIGEKQLLLSWAPLEKI
jgi:DNA helicase II / ATP-dependent DNA helicase PcrA